MIHNILYHNSYGTLCVPYCLITKYISPSFSQHFQNVNRMPPDNRKISTLCLLQTPKCKFHASPNCIPTDLHHVLMSTMKKKSKIGFDSLVDVLSATFHALCPTKKKGPKARDSPTSHSSNSIPISNVTCKGNGKHQTMRVVVQSLFFNPAPISSLLLPSAQHD